MPHPPRQPSKQRGTIEMQPPATPADIVHQRQLLEADLRKLDEERGIVCAMRTEVEQEVARGVLLHVEDKLTCPLCVVQYPPLFAINKIQMS